jgi:hypothetical protein
MNSFGWRISYTIWTVMKIALAYCAEKHVVPVVKNMLDCLCSQKAYSYAWVTGDASNFWVRCTLSTWIAFETLKLWSCLTGACGRDLWAWSFRENNSCSSCHCWSSKVREGYVNRFMISVTTSGCGILMTMHPFSVQFCRFCTSFPLPRSTILWQMYWIHLIVSWPDSLQRSRCRSQGSEDV